MAVHSEEDLVHRCRDGEPEAWKEFVRRHSGVLERTVRQYRLGDQEVDDVRQQTWLRAVEHLSELREPDKVGSWLAMIARREVLRLFRSRSRCQPVETEVLETKRCERADVEGDVLGRLLRHEVEARLREMSRGDRTLLRMCLSDSPPSYSSISRSMSIPVGSIGPMRQRALARLRRRMSGSDSLRTAA